MKEINFTPRSTQESYYYYDPAPLTLALILAHRRAGKSEGYIAVRLLKLLERLRMMTEVPIIGKDVRLEYPRLTFMAKTKEQARNIIWSYLIKYLSIYPGVAFDHHKLKVQIPRPIIGDFITYSLKAARNYEDLRGEKNFEIMMDEYQDYPMGAREVVYLSLTDLRGALYASGTAKGKDNILYKLMKDMINPHHPLCGEAFMYPIHMTDVIPDEDLKIIRANVSPEAYAREYELNFNVGYGQTYYGELLGKFTNMVGYQRTYHSHAPLVLANDLGVGKSCAAWLVQVQGHDLVLLDYYEDYELLKEMRNDILDDWGRVPEYVILPHDGSRRQIAYDRKTRIKDVYKQAFPESKFLHVKKTPSKAEDITLCKENFTMIKYFDQKEKASDLSGGLSKLSVFGPKTNDSGIIMGQVDKSTGATHCGDAFRYIFRGLKVKDGKIGIKLGQRREFNRQAMKKMPTFSRRRAYA